MADPDRLKQVLLNLIRNAIEAMPNGGTLTVRGYQSNSLVTGLGVTEGLDDLAFSPAADSLRLGLGLAVSRQITEDMGGTLTYASESGRGTVFFVTLPKKTV